MNAWVISLLVMILLGGTGLGCKSPSRKKLEATYGPTESIIEVIAVLRRHVPDDTYRFPPATDFTGRNVYRSTLLRLESIERIHADPLRSGYMDPVIQFSKGRALERLRAYDLAAAHYREAAMRKTPLEEEAVRSADVCERMHEAIAIGVQEVNPLDPAGTPISDGKGRSPDQVTQELDERVALLSFLHDEEEETHYRYIIAEEIEHADRVRAAWFAVRRYQVADGQLRALAELQRVVRRHAGSKNNLQHMLELAGLYNNLAHEYVDAIPPSSLEFDPALFQDLVDPATRLYEMVASHDGTTAKLEASRKLEAFLAFTLTVDRDRFTH